MGMVPCEFYASVDYKFLIKILVLPVPVTLEDCREMLGISKDASSTCRLTQIR